MGKTIVICDDHILFLRGISEVLKRFGKNYSIITFNDSISCKLYLKEHRADVFICDLNIDTIDGFALINELKSYLKSSKTIILTGYFEDFLIQKAEKLGIHAFLRKESTAEELIAVIDADLSTPFYTNKQVAKPINLFTSKDDTFVNKIKLSKQEKEIIKLIIDGKTSKEIALLLNISKTTVDTHRKNINRKLEISNSSSLIKFAHENNLFS